MRRPLGIFCYMKDKYKKLAEKFLDAPFGVYGIGNFDIFEDELAKILEILIEKDGVGLQEYYEELEQKRMG